MLTPQLLNIEGKLRELCCAQSFVNCEDRAPAIARDAVKAPIDQASWFRIERERIANARTGR
jgi:hypothetical protein